MDQNNLHSRQKAARRNSDNTQNLEKEKMPLKDRKQHTENYDFDDVQKIPSDIRDIMNRNFLRLFICELYFGELLLFLIIMVLRE